MATNNAVNVQNFVQMFNVMGINSKSTGATQIFTPTAQFTPLDVVFELTGSSAVISVASCSIGTNAASYNDILPISILTGLTSLNNILRFPLNALISSIAQSTGIFVNVTTGAVATTYQIKCSITGYYN